jgi:hypothetical protein
LADYITSVAEAADKSVGIVEKLWQGIESIRNKKLSQENFLRAYYLEVVNNLEFLQVVDLESLKDLSPSDHGVKMVLSNLQTEYGAAILFSEEFKHNVSLFKFFRNRGALDNKDNMINNTQKAGSAPRKYVYENILQAIGFTVVKIQVLKRLSTFPDSLKGITQPIQLGRRLYNISARFRMIKKKLESLDEIKDFAR